jgi:hypothetical protein
MEDGMDVTENSAMTEASGLTNGQQERESSSLRRHRDELDSRHPLLRASDRLRTITLAAPLPSLFAAFVLGILVARRR